jgi:hypothetical protein
MVTAELSGLTKEHYDKVMDLLEFDAKPLQGLIFDCAGQASPSWRVFDIWESQEAFDRFVKASRSGVREGRHPGFGGET